MVYFCCIVIHRVLQDKPTQLGPKAAIKLCSVLYQHDNDSTISISGTITDERESGCHRSRDLSKDDSHSDVSVFKDDSQSDDSLSKDDSQSDNSFSKESPKRRRQQVTLTSGAGECYLIMSSPSGGVNDTVQGQCWSNQSIRPSEKMTANKFNKSSSGSDSDIRMKREDRNTAGHGNADSKTKCDESDSSGSSSDEYKDAEEEVPRPVNIKGIAQDSQHCFKEKISVKNEVQNGKCLLLCSMREEIEKHDGCRISVDKRSHVVKVNAVNDTKLKATVAYIYQLLIDMHSVPVDISPSLAEKMASKQGITWLKLQKL